MRASASLYVLLFHASTVKVEGHGAPSRIMQLGLSWLNHGRLGVVFFIVLSGFSLMLPLARAGSFELLKGFWSYIYRRAKRIFPPYYAALSLSIGLVVAFNAFGPARGGGAPIEAALKPGSVLSHLLLVHNLTFEWSYRINGPMWSVATEWQIYFLFPLMLLPIWRLAGGVATVVVAWVLGSLPFFLLPSSNNFFWACPWFVGSFALGMAGAVIGFSPAASYETLRSRVPWAWLAMGLLVVLIVCIGSGWADTLGYPVVDLTVSLFAFSWINACVQRTAGGGAGGVGVRILSSKALVYLAGFSYSLYLVQHPVLRFTEKVVNRLRLGYDASIAVQMFVGISVVLATAWLFAEVFERPFTTGALLVPALRRRFRPEQGRNRHEGAA